MLDAAAIPRLVGINTMLVGLRLLPMQSLTRAVGSVRVRLRHLCRVNTHASRKRRTP